MFTISETLRMHPPIANIGRVATKDYPVPGTNLVVPKGLLLFIPAYSIHHDPEIYPDPEVFDPERFAPEQVRDRSSCAFLPFGEGPRNCIGLRFAMMQVRVGLITLLLKYKFETCAKSVVPIVYSKENFVLGPKDGVWLNVKKI